MKVLIADKFPEAQIHELRAHGFEVAYSPDVTADALVRAEPSAIWIVRSTKVTAAAIANAKALELVVRAGAGVDTIDVDAASARGIYVANCPGKNSVAVAELAMGLLLAVDRRIVLGTEDLRRGTWNKKEYSQADGLKGRTLGVVGLGAIGQAVARRALSFDMHVLTHSVPRDPDLEQALGVHGCASLLELAARSDAVSVHVPQGESTKKMFGVEFFAHMRPRAIFINTSRGGVVDQPALERAMKEKGIRAGLDVYDPEPDAGAGAFAIELAKLPQFVGTHHIGASTEQAQTAIATEAVRICLEYSKFGHVPHCVNIERHAPAKVQLLVRHYDRVGVLAAVLEIIRNHGINVEDMNNTIFRGAKTAVATLKLSAEPPPSLLEEISGLSDKVIQVSAKSC